MALKNNLKITILRIYDPVSPTIEMNFERKLSDKFTLQLLYGKIFSYFENDLLNAPSLDINGSRKAIELKYFIKKTAPIGTYVSFEFQKLSSITKTTMNFYRQEPDSLFRNYFDFGYVDTIKVNRKINVFNVKIGRQIIRRNIVFDFFTGLGIRHRNVSHIDRQFPSDNLIRSRHGSIKESVNTPGTWFTPNFNLNLKIGFAFK